MMRNGLTIVGALIALSTFGLPKAEGQLQIASVFNGTLVVVAGNGSDTFGISNFDNDATKIELKDYVTTPATVHQFENVSNVWIDLGGGDNVLLTYGPSYTAPNTILGSCSVFGGSGDDHVQVSALTIYLDTEISLGNGDNEVLFGNCHLLADFRIETGTGRDVIGGVSGYDGVYGEALGDCDFNLGAGDDELHMNAFECAGEFSLATGSGRDFIRIHGSSGGRPSLFQRNCAIRTGRDKDTVQVFTTDVSQRLSIELGSGNDDLWIDDTSANGHFLSGGSGSDEGDKFASPLLNGLQSFTVGFETGNLSNSFSK
ncbi:hypothetical protein Poly51_06200 [Rubripirellula tenax]|uniref:Uncharacterized protein n=2 Tax=Rubripirellula tenax TaxID=2528015 RepID=A0A5C6FHQ8_9BACT|nr:hypothetical protein Poly51_06200 [Rubripirellula tenax]